MSNGKKWLFNLVLAFGLGAGAAALNGTSDALSVLKAGAAAAIASAVGVKTKLAPPASEDQFKTAAGGR